MASKKALQKRVNAYSVADLGRPAGERWVTMTNALTRSGHGLTLAEKRIVMMAVSKLNSREEAPANNALTTRITAMEFASFFSLT